MKEGTQEALVLIVLLKELLTESTFFGSQVQKFFVIELTAELLCQLPGDDAATGTYLPAYVNDYLLVLHIESDVFAYSCVSQTISSSLPPSLPR